ncbi:hypothetical protein Pla175_29320 [Pirellulimonas nuda]|uniref:Uncharacterized protein n=1 Tax=Pirellulimonas nuda TaxID=2528009 RepID=A0A518DDJ2_9BACT|nr:hypothetical protein [Pirellulimonas nuda]QDU89540.1 hypothetical protein Pla175_29320 [Pirellulimonas nuda]
MSTDRRCETAGWPLLRLAQMQAVSLPTEDFSDLPADTRRTPKPLDGLHRRQAFVGAQIAERGSRLLRVSWGTTWESPRMLPC